ncbi:MAG: chemotaxis protein CheA [gamma proteobacterium endosymbiont of Lamellibrachia anaximandri]|nr:chemotaxis protein CheA [gamma proteobacterium endosymbiont of Lamellibrachia anaximandri]MBL3617876.1 chemotaxis protein CheA [gamma proteobacterium endosymbiont of Lamellibrachia anaximandri]
MSIDLNDEILQDFLVEAGEILELLGEQLVDLEQQTDDYDLLNAVFRGFHTIKGGAGFLAIDSLVEICHKSEDVFNILRQGQRKITPDLMDVVLQVVDVVNEMFDEIRGGEMPDNADPELIKQLKFFTVPEGEEKEEPVAEAPPAPRSEPNPESQSNKGDLSDDEFEELLDAIQTPDTVEATAGGDEITEDEFESLLDDLHGKGKFSSQSGEETEKTSPVGSDEISEDEFETLLDDLHGKGKFSGATKTVKSEVAQPAAVAKPKPKPEKASAVQAPQKTKSKSPPAPKGAAKPQSAETTVRVDTQRLDDIMNMVGELVLVRNRLATLKATMNDEDVSNAVGNLDVVTSDLQLAVMKTRMQPIKKIFGRFPRVVRDLARTMKKEIDLEMEGEDTDLDKNLVEALADPLVHLVRNSVDHGIEMPDERESVGKPRRGTVLLTAAQEGDHILLSISDDGKGMDPNVLRQKAVEKGMMDQEAAARLDDRECFNLIFQPGFSTKTEISDVSGRGVGMDVVKTRISQMNGSVEIDSENGRGSTITIKLPLTLAILPTLMVVLGTQPFALPLASVVEIFNLDLNRTNVVDGQLTIMVRERALPLFYLSQWLVQNSAMTEEEKSSRHVVVVNVGSIQVGLVVDELIGQEEVVIKPLGAMLQGLEGMAGATITGDGKIALIMDVPGLMRKYARKY